MTECPICCDKYNKSTRKPINCESSSCDFCACKDCVRTYLTTTLEDPGCMNCKRVWSQRFLAEKLNKSFVTGDLKKYRGTILADREMSRLQESMEAAQRLVAEEELEKERQTVHDRIQLLKEQLAIENRNLVGLQNRIFNLRHFGEGGTTEGATKEKKQFIMPCPAANCRGFLSTAWKCELCSLYTCKDCFEILGDKKTDEHTCHPDNLASAELIRKETKSCPACGTRIFKIDGCDQMWCTQCKVAFSWRTGKICSSQSIHNPHYLEWQRNTQGETMRAVGDVPCGGLISWYRCDSLTHKISGLTVYSNKELCRVAYGQTIPEKLVSDFGFNPAHLMRVFYDVYRVANDIVNTSVPAYRRNVTYLQDYSPIRVQYILNRIDKTEFGKRVYAQDQKRQKTQQVLHILELLSSVLCETFNEVTRFAFSSETRQFVPLSERFPFVPSTCPTPDAIYEIIEKQYQPELPPSKSSKPNIISKLAEASFNSDVELAYVMVGALERLNGLFQYCNGELAIISSSFSSSTPHIRTYPNFWQDTTVWRTGDRVIEYERTHRYRAKDLKTLKQTDMLTEVTSEIPIENVKISKT